MLGTVIFLGSIILFALALTAIASRRLEQKYPAFGNFIQTSVGRLHYCERNPDDPAKSVVILLHGASGNLTDLLIPLADRLVERGYRVVGLDRPGLGWSDRKASHFPLALQREILAQAQAALVVGDSRSIVVAHSLAGALAVDLAINHPQLIRGLVLLGPVTHPWSTGVAWYYRLAATPVLGWWFTHTIVLPLGFFAIRSALQSVFRPRSTPANYREQTRAALALTPGRFRANARDVVSLQTAVRRIQPNLSSIEAPTAILAGGDDKVVSTEIHSKAAARAIPGAQLTLMPGVGHSPHWADPDAVVAAIEDVFKRSENEEEQRCFGSTEIRTLRP